MKMVEVRDRKEKRICAYEICVSATHFSAKPEVLLLEKVPEESTGRCAATHPVGS